MKPAQAFGPNYAARIRRAQDLTTAKPFAAEILCFYLQIATFQKDLFDHCRAATGPRNTTLLTDSSPDEFLAHLPLRRFAAFLALVERAGPPPLAEAARLLAQQAAGAWERALTAFLLKRSLSGPSIDPVTAFFSRGFLQPYLELVAARMPAPDLDSRPRLCPLCGAPPLLGVLRPEGDGGKRSLVCSFCSFEWDFRRILCPACGEEREEKLPVYVSEQLAHIRVECCDTCKRYIRTIDLTKDGHAVPLVDDLAAIPLGLWAAENGYIRLQPNLLGT